MTPGTPEFQRSKISGTVLCFGELLLRLAFDSEGAWLQQHAFTVYPAGAEANVACALAKWNIPVAYFTALPDHKVTANLLGWLNERGVDTSLVRLEGKRMGLYFLPTGKDIKKGGVIYDRAGSSFGQLRKGMINWEQVLADKSWFHVSAISPALSEEMAELCEEALETASKMGTYISIDLNYRAALWQYGKTPSEIMPRLAKYAHLIMGNIWSANKLLNISIPESRLNGATKAEYLEISRFVAEEIQRSYSKCISVSHTFRFDVGAGILYYGTFFENGRQFVSAEYNRPDVVDKVGSGDCFMAGLIYGHFRQLDPQSMIDFATAAAFLKLGEKGDTMNLGSAEIDASVTSGKS